jgi:DNA-binding NtrC family response regulator
MEHPYKVAVVDDESESLAAMVRALKRVGYEVLSFEDGEAALKHPEVLKDIDVVVTDLKMPRVTGLDLLKEVRSINQEAGFLIVTAHGTVETAVEALKSGADDYILKPLDLYELRERVHHILQTRRAQLEIRQLLRQLGQQSGMDNIVAQSPVMKHLLKQIALVAPTKSTVLLLGESGTGKDLIAHTLHRHGSRSQETFLPLNCAALSPTLLESELFGYEKGAFTGAQERRIGKLELANRGTLFLDEIGELPLDMQVKLLRFLETRELMRVGGTSTLKLDVRVIAATNLDLTKAVEEGKFRQDLYYRLKVVTLQVPPLRDRLEDLPLLAVNFLHAFSKEHQRPLYIISPEALDAFRQYLWPGNVRELRNLMESLVVFSRKETLTLEDLPPDFLLPATAIKSDPFPSQTNSTAQTGPSEVLPMSEVEKRTILKALESTGGNRVKAAQMLGIGLRTLQTKLKEYGMVGRSGNEPP